MQFSIKLFIGVFLFCFLNGQAQEQLFSRNQVLEDLDLLEQKLIQWHPNLFVYSDKSAFDNFFLKLKKEIPESISEHHLFRKVNLIHNVIKDGHTIMLPGSQGFVESTYNYGIFPMDIHWDQSNMWIIKNCSENTDISEGSKIKSINGIAAGEVFDFLLERMMRDGMNQTYGTWVLNSFFKHYYRFFFHFPSSFDLEIELPNGKLINRNIKALASSDVEQCRSEKLKENLGPNDWGIGTGIRLNLFGKEKYAVLTIPDFDSERLKSYDQSFKPEIKKLFRTIREAGIEHLLLNLQNNQGGRIQNGAFLLSYLMTEPFQMVEAYNKVDGKNADSEAKRLRPSKGPCMGLISPRPDAYRGELSVLVNGGSFSNTGIVSAVLQKYKRGIIYGEETGGSKNILAGDIKTLKLPNTKLIIQIPTLQFVLAAGEPSTYSGIIPDILLKPNIEDLIKDNFGAVEYLLQMIIDSRSSSN